MPGLDLMEAAGTAIADAIRRRWSRRPLVVLCGPGSNGGDGFVVARLLAASGWPVRVALAGERRRLKGDAAVNAERWHGDVVPLSVAALDGARLVIDALFGAGLARPIEGTARAVVEGINARRLHCVAVDTPSGVHGDSGAIMGDAPKARLTVTFFRPKPGHFLLPGRLHRGDLVVADIGIPEEVLDVIRPQTFVNGPALWAGRLPRPSADDNKYTRGHALVVGGEMTGAARLAARGARRVGAGLVTVACAPELRAIYGSDWPGTIVTPVADDAEFATVLADSRKNAVLIGPGTGVSAWTRRRVLTILETGKRVVLDADALTVFEADPGSLFQAIRSPCLLTPHEGNIGACSRLTGTRSRGRAARRGCRAPSSCSRAEIRSSPRPTGARRSRRRRRPSWQRPAPETSSPEWRSVCWPRAWTRSTPDARPPGCTARRPWPSGGPDRRGPCGSVARRVRQPRRARPALADIPMTEPGP